MPRSVRVLDKAIAELVAEMLQDATRAAGATGGEPHIDLDTVIDRAVRASGQRPD